MVHAVLRRALRQAVKWNMIPRNPAEVVDRPRAPRPEIKPLDVGQGRQLLEAARGDRLEALYVLAPTTGLRQGETARSALGGCGVWSEHAGPAL